jgi:preprotein translocase subunit YajC
VVAVVQVPFSLVFLVVLVVVLVVAQLRQTGERQQVDKEMMAEIL